MIFLNNTFEIHTESWTALTKMILQNEIILNVYWKIDVSALNKTYQVCVIDIILFNAI